MNVNTIVIEPEVAKAKLDEYRSLVAEKRTEEDDLLRSLYKSVVKGARVINIAQAFKSTGLNAFAQPKLAIARADKKEVWFRGETYVGSGSERALVFDSSGDQWFNSQKTRSHVRIPADTFSPSRLPNNQLRSAVPHIPPAIRPTKLENYHILFEVEKWDEYPVDPFLLRRISGYLYVVEAEWELTPLEASLLGSMGSGR